MARKELLDSKVIKEFRDSLDFKGSRELRAVWGLKEV